MTQKRLVMKKDDLDTPAAILKKGLGLNANALGLPTPHPLGKLARARDASAEVSPSSLRTKPRSKDAELKKVTSMARAERRLLGGGDSKRFYDGGHLIGDQLIGGEEETSFDLGNLAPQTVDFNRENYLKIEDWIKKKVCKLNGISEEECNDKKALAAKKKMMKGNEIAVKVEAHLEYPRPYSLDVKEIRKRLGLTDEKTKALEGTKIDFPRRIPKKWTLRIERPKGIPGDPNKAKKTPLLDTLTEPEKPTIADPHSLKLGKREWDPSKGSKVREMTARQWVPRSKTREVDIFSLLNKAFPELKEVIELELVKKGHVPVREEHLAGLMAASSKVMNTILAALQESAKSRDKKKLSGIVNDTAPVIQSLVATSLQPGTLLLDSITTLLTANTMAQELKEDIQDLVKEEMEREALKKEKETAAKSGSSTRRTPRTPRGSLTPRTDQTSPPAQSTSTPYKPPRPNKTPVTPDADGAQLTLTQPQSVPTAQPVSASSADASGVANPRVAAEIDLKSLISEGSAVVANFHKSKEGFAKWDKAVRGPVGSGDRLQLGPKTWATVRWVGVEDTTVRVRFERD